MTKKCVRIAYRSETNEKEEKMGRIGPLLGVPYTWVKSHEHR